MAPISDYFNLVHDLSLNGEINEEVEKLVSQLKSSRGTCFIVGNGGSAAIAEHFVTDLGRAQNNAGRTIRALYLGSNTSLITADSNDFGYAEIFSRQIASFASNGDTLVAISSSGNSPNIVSALLQSKQVGVLSFALTGFDGGQAARVCDVSIHIPSAIGSYESVEDIHSMICHFVAMRLKNRI